MAKAALRAFVWAWSAVLVSACGGSGEKGLVPEAIEAGALEAGGSADGWGDGEIVDAAVREEAGEPEAGELGDADELDDGGPDADAPGYDPNRFITRIVSFTPGTGAGFGQNRLPAVLYGPPHGGGACRGATDVLTLGTGGEIVVEFVDNAVVDGPGVDLLVFENPFQIGCSDPANLYAELGEVSVSEDGVHWVTFPCTATSYPYGACAGWHPVLSHPNNGISPFDPIAAGGDPFDLADVGVKRAKYVRVRDAGTKRDAGGFDLDAISIVNAERL